MTDSPVSSPKKPILSDSVVLIPTTDQLALRATPGVDGVLLRRFSLETPLHSLESATATLSKLGVEGQWLNIQTMDGEQGFVAAWYLRAADAIAPSMGMPESAPAVPEPAPAPLLVCVTEDQLAFRAAPVIAEDNLIARFATGTQLTAIDPDAGQKIGVANQWLKVADASGREGYVAAWYVSKQG